MIPRPLVKSEEESREIYTPAELAQKIQGSFDERFGSIWVEGEISELAIPFSGHAYFTLKDSRAKLRAVMWKGRRPYAGGALVDGQRVLAKGRLAVYAPRGEFQLVADYLEPRGEGALLLAYEKLKAKLGEEGLFAEAKKRPIPYWPERVALISSPTGAAVRDFLVTAMARRPGAKISLYPVRVQGREAAAEIAGAIHDLGAWGGFDLIVLTRGGGSLADLWAFNEEAVVRAVAAARIPTLAAIGHSTDLSLTEMAADARAITPTAAAEAVFRDQAALSAHLAEAEARLVRCAHEAIRRGCEQTERLTRRLAEALRAHYAGREARFENARSRLGRLEFVIGRKGQDLDYLLRELSRAMEKFLDNDRRGLEKLAIKLQALSPENVLKRGYALVTRLADGRAVTGTEGLKAGEELTIRWAEGRAISTIKEIS